MHRFRSLLVVAFSLELAVMAYGCEPSSASLYERPWPCDANLADPGCGTTRDGKPMTCFAASDLGGTDFCAQACDPTLSTADASHFCTASGALLRTCMPGVANRGCPDGFNCFRTSLDLRDRSGVCIEAPTCRNDSDCSAESPRLTCGATVVRETYPSPYLITDHLQCLQRCGKSPEYLPCPDGQQCLTQLFPDDWSIPNICVPHCEAGGRRCPPNYFCLADAGPAYADGGSYCVPGIPGRRCSHQQDCIIGDCVNVGDTKVCALACDSDQLCENLNNPTGTFYCALKVDAAAPGRCVARGPIAGAYCRGDRDCNDKEVCSAFDPFAPGIAKAARAMECHRTCSGPGTCQSPLSVPFSCIATADGHGECYPADFGVPCTAGAEPCMGALSCLETHDGEGAPQSICTRPCSAQSPCDTYTLTSQGHCESGLCRRRHASGHACNSSDECNSLVCQETGGCL
jgi:hypothetical protein